MKEQKTVVMLPTNEASSLGISANKLMLAPHHCKWMNSDGTPSIAGQHLYVLSDERIQVGDWVVDFENRLYQINKEIAESRLFNEICLHNKMQKVIATTDSKLWTKKIDCPECKGTGWGATSIYCEKCPDPGGKITQEGIAKISTDFIQAYIKAYNEGSPIKEIMVEYEMKESVYDGPESWYMSADKPDIKKQLKLREDGSIIIHPVKERMFNMQQAVQIFLDGRNAANYQVVDVESFISEHYPVEH